ncbi:PHA/PHB synthase family protein [Dongia sp.]|uniref:PHA/PHB synthase family protein n=1 Tax=Dongia sp. TaxID=1977262 RepID=UPI0035AEF1E4
MDDGIAHTAGAVATQQKGADPSSAAMALDLSRPEAPKLADLDRFLHALQGQLTGSFSPTIVSLALTDWLLHLANAPGLRMELWLKICEIQLADLDAVGRQFLPSEEGSQPAPTDRRFSAPDWQATPFSVFYQSYLRWEEWWGVATGSVSGVKASHQRVLAFLARQYLDFISPANQPICNPEVLRTTLVSQGANLRRGFANLIDDLHLGSPAGEAVLPQRSFKIGHDLAATPGVVVYRNEHMELIQYAPMTAEVAREPILIVPAWIMKYYVLDLTEHNSVVRHLVASGFTVFMISWRNPGSAHRHWSMDDYRQQGIACALEAIAAIRPGAAVHGCGYCLGGTLLAIDAARMARDNDGRLASMTLLAAQTDFTEAGPIQVFTSEDQVAFLEDVMWQRGYLDGAEMSAAFKLLRANDLIWNRFVRQYLLGERDSGTDITAWNADVTRLPQHMHAEYLRRLFIRNELAQGHYLVDRRPVVLSDIRTPIFAVGTETDHVAPWQSVYKIRLLSRAEVTFVLTNGGHNAGIVSEPGHARRHYRLSTSGPFEPYLDPGSWIGREPAQEGSWWPAWSDWLRRHSSTGVIPAAVLPPGLGAAPGAYVLEA